VYTPDSEPYLGRRSVYHFDVVLRRFIDEQVRIADWTHNATLSDLQQAASELVPSASSIALSIRELVRQGYLMSALVLTRPPRRSSAGVGSFSVNQRSTVAGEAGEQFTSPAVA
jgi:hypothetical protein